jgi:hypothetical protein
MITAHEISDRWENTKWTIYKSTWRNDVPMGFEYEVAREARVQKPRLPRPYIVNWEGIDYSNNCQTYGYEIKSPVAPLHYHKFLIRKHKFKDIKWNTDPFNRGGIHVNISNDIRRGHQRRDKIADFLAANRDEMCQLSGRREEHFNLFAQSNCESYHYYNILSTRKSTCFELRMFHAQPHLLLPALEFADSTFMLATEAGAITMDKWIKFINRWPRYRNIAQHVRNTLCGKSTSLPTPMVSMDTTSSVSTQIAA